MRPCTIPLATIAAAAATLVGAAPASAILAAAVGTGDDPSTARIVVARNDGSDARVLARGQTPIVSPNGRRVAVTNYAAGTFKVFAATGGPAKLTVSAGNLIVWGWAPNSRKLVAGDGTARHLFLIDARTGVRTPLASTRGSIGRPSFSPGGRRLAYVVRPRQSTFAGTLKVLDLATRRRHTLRRGADSPAWGPRRIAFSVLTRRRDGQFIWNVATVRPDGKGLRRLTRVHSTAQFFGLEPAAWSANGRRLLTTTAGADGYWLNTYGVDAVHGGARLIAPHVEATGFSRDGRYIIGQNGDAECCGFTYTDVVRVPWTGGAPQVLIHHAMFASYSG